MRIEIENVGAQGRSFAHTYQDGELEFTDERVRLLEGPEVSGVISNKGREVTATGRVVARTEVDCDRCLKSVEIPVRAEFSLRYVNPSEYERIHAAELEESDLAISVFDGEAIDVDEIVREQVLLAVPTRSLCQEGCKGFCPTCGGDRNLKECDCQTEAIDPRWAGLRDLTDRKS